MARAIAKNTTTTNTTSESKGTYFLNFYDADTGAQLFYRCIDSNEELLAVLLDDEDNCSLMFNTEYVNVKFTERGVKKEVSSNLKEKLAQAKKTKKSA